jgi:hypothetical protein
LEMGSVVSTTCARFVVTVELWCTVKPIPEWIFELLSIYGVTIIFIPLVEVFSQIVFCRLQQLAAENDLDQYFVHKHPVPPQCNLNTSSHFYFLSLPYAATPDDFLLDCQI